MIGEPPRGTPPRGIMRRGEIRLPAGAPAPLNCFLAIRAGSGSGATAARRRFAKVAPLGCGRAVVSSQEDGVGSGRNLFGRVGVGVGGILLGCGCMSKFFGVKIERALE